MEWLHQYEACGEYIQKMIPDDFLEFVYAVTFSKQMISQVTATLTHTSSFLNNINLLTSQVVSCRI